MSSKITDLTDGDPAQETDELYVNRGGLDRKVTAGSIADLATGGGGGGGYDEGTSFPGSPSTGDKFYRTDRNLLYFYDGTRWLTVQQFHITIPANPSLAAFFSATTASVYQVSTPATPATDFYAETLRWTSHVGTTNNGTSYWQAVLAKLNGAGSSTTIVTGDTSADTVNVFTEHETTINALLGTTFPLLNVSLTKVSAPGNISPYPPTLVGRLAG
jgi:hypothetical protein